jgi:hypothetical protein
VSAAATRAPGAPKTGGCRSKRTVPADAPGPQITVSGPFTTVSLSNVSGAMYDVGASIRAVQAPSIDAPFVSTFTREPNMLRSTGSPFVPPLRTVRKPGMVLR